MMLCGLSIYPYCYFIHFCPSIIFTLSVKSPSFQIYTIRSFVSCLQLYLLVFLPSLPRGAAAFPFLWWDYLYHAIPIATPNTLAMVPFYFLGFYSYYVLTPEDLEFRASNKKEWENMSFLVRVISLNMIFSSSAHSACKVHNFILLYSWMVLHSVYAPIFVIH